jgi:hypothetical protein
MEESKEVNTPPPTIRQLLPHGQSATITMSNESHMAELETRQRDNTERLHLLISDLIALMLEWVKWNP